MAQHTTTQKERIASLEAYIAAHVREHTLTERVWEAKLDAIDARLAQIERMLINGRDEGDGANGGIWRRLSRRDISVASGAAAVTSVLWWLAALLRTAGIGS